jgi:hypothetical protein
MTGRDLVTATLKKIGVLASGETPTADEATDALSELNRMLGFWSTEGLLIFATTAETALTLTPGDATITLGASGDITTRPQAIESAVIRDGNTDFPLKVLTLTEYASITNKSIQSTLPEALYDDGGYPQRTITLWPVPSAAKSLVLFTKRALTEIATLDTTVSLPPGYEDTIIYNLAVRLGPDYGRAVSDAVVMMAMETKASLKRANYKPSVMSMDPAMVGVSGRFNVLTGEYKR